MATRPKAVIESRNGEKFSPITIAKNVLTDDGQNLHDILSDRKEDMMTPTIENSSSMSKVGQGDNVDFSDNVMNGAYDSMSKVGQGDNVDFSDNVMNGAYEDVVLKGKSLVNVIQGSSKDKVTLDSENATAYPVVIKPNTKYSIIAHKDCNYQTDNLIYTFDLGGKDKVTLDSENATAYPVVIKPNTKYSIIAHKDCNYQTDNLIYTFDLGGATITCSVNDTITTVTTPSTLAHQELRVEGQGLAISSVRVIEGEVTQDLPYFEGICDVKSPMVKNVGKNLFDIDGEWVRSTYGFNTVSQSKENQVYTKIGANEFKIETGSRYENGFGQYIDVQGLEEVRIKATFNDFDTKSPSRIMGARLNKDESLDESITNANHEHYRRGNFAMQAKDGVIDMVVPTNGYSTLFVIFSGSWKNNELGNHIFTVKDVYVGANEDYEPYQSNTTTFTSNDGKTIVLRSLPNGVCDTLNVRTVKDVYVGANEDYEPYQSNTTTFTSNDGKTIVLRSLPNGVCDTLNVRTGEYVQRIGEITLDGTKRDDLVYHTVLKDNDGDFIRMIINGCSFYDNNKYGNCGIGEITLDGTKRDDLVYHTVLKDNDGDFIRMIINGCSFYDNNKYGNCDKLPFYHEEKTKDSVEAVFPFAGEKHFYIKIKTSRINGAETMENNSSQLRDAFLNWLAQNPITIQYELATPIVKQVNVEGYPYAYENGHILLESGSQEQSLTPTRLLVLMVRKQWKIIVAN